MMRKPKLKDQYDQGQPNKESENLFRAFIHSPQTDAGSRLGDGESGRRLRSSVGTRKTSNRVQVLAAGKEVKAQGGKRKGNQGDSESLLPQEIKRGKGVGEKAGRGKTREDKNENEGRQEGGPEANGDVEAGPQAAAKAALNPARFLGPPGTDVILLKEKQDALLAIADELVDSLSPLRFSLPTTHVYNPLVYARASYEQYIRTCGGRTGVIMLVGMNPGPWGMSQTGVPFGDVVMVRDFVGIRAEVGAPPKVHPSRPVDGFNCKRREVSGSRLWGWARDRYGTRDAFFDRFWVYNWCPLAFMEASGKNRTPDKLSAEERNSVTALCDVALARVIHVLQPGLVVGLGNFAAQRAKKCGAGDEVIVGSALHPSPASPAANKDWSGTFEAQLRKLGVEF